VATRHRSEPQQLDCDAGSSERTPHGEARQQGERRRHDQGSGEEQKASCKFQIIDSVQSVCGSPARSLRKRVSQRSKSRTIKNLEPTNPLPRLAPRFPLAGECGCYDTNIVAVPDNHFFREVFFV
jgi:hypothetical protein